MRPMRRHLGVGPRLEHAEEQSGNPLWRCRSDRLRASSNESSGVVGRPTCMVMQGETEDHCTFVVVIPCCRWVKMTGLTPSFMCFHSTACALQGNHSWRLRGQGVAWEVLH